MRTDTDILIRALEILSEDIISSDGVANAAIFEAADRLRSFKTALENIASTPLCLQDDISWIDLRSIAEKALE